MSNREHEHGADAKIGFVLLTIFKDEDEHVVLQRSHKSLCDSREEMWNEVAAELGKRRQLGKPSIAAKPPTDMSIPLEDGDFTYVIKLDANTRAAFGPGPHPIMIMPSMLGKELLSEIALIYKDSKGATIRITQNNIPHDYGSLPANAALSFRCSLAKMKAAWAEIVNGAGHSTSNVRIPFFLNLFDKKTGKPVWTYGSGYHGHGQSHGQHDHEHAEPTKSRVHGGIHPDTVTQFFYYP